MTNHHAPTRREWAEPAHPRRTVRFRPAGIDGKGSLSGRLGGGLVVLPGARMLRGRHPNLGFHEGGSVNDLAAFLAGEAGRGSPSGTSRDVADAMQALNDWMTEHERELYLRVHLTRMPYARRNARLQSFVIADYVLRSLVPDLLDVLGADVEADTLRSTVPVINEYAAVLGARSARRVFLRLKEYCARRRRAEKPVPIAIELCINLASAAILSCRLASEGTPNGFSINGALACLDDLPFCRVQGSRIGRHTSPSNDRDIVEGLARVVREGLPAPAALREQLCAGMDGFIRDLFSVAAP